MHCNTTTRYAVTITQVIFPTVVSSQSILQMWCPIITCEKHVQKEVKALWATSSSSIVFLLVIIGLCVIIYRQHAKKYAFVDDDNDPPMEDSSNDESNHNHDDPNRSAIMVPEDDPNGQHTGAASLNPTKSTDDSSLVSIPLTTMGQPSTKPLGGAKQTTATTITNPFYQPYN